MGLPTLNAKYYNEATVCEQKWAADGYLDGLPRNSKRDRDVRLATALMMENQALANEQMAASGTGADDIAQFRRITVPMVRRFFPQLIAHHIVGVQPLIGPSGYVFYMRFRAGIEKGNQDGIVGNDFATAGARDINYNDSPNTGWDNASLQQTQDGIPVVPIYYSHQRVQLENVNIRNLGDPITGGTGKTYTFSKTPVLSNSCLASAADVAAMGGNEITAGQKYTAWGKVYYGETTAPNAGGTLCQYFSITGTTVHFTNVPGATHYIDSATFTLSSGAFVATWHGSETTTSLRSVCYEYDMECNRDLPRITLVVEQDIVEAKTRKLRADWSLEAQQDLRSQHNLDVEAELTSFLAEEVNLEIDREVVGDVRDNAGTVAVWDYATSLGDTIKEKYESLYVKLVEVSNQIHKKTLRSHANWIVASPEVVAIFETATAGFAPSPSQGFESNIGIQYVGTVNGRYRVFKDPSAPQDQIVMGYRGESMLDVGYFYCPYVALQQSPLLYDPESWCPRKGVMTRYGKILLREGSRFYARISLINFFV